MWYKRSELAFRLALFFSAATCAGAFGGLLARGIMEMDNIGGRTGWQWIFIIEGLATAAVAVYAFFVMNDYPSDAKFLTPDERKETTRRLAEDSSSLADEYNMRYFWDAIQDWKIWVQMFILVGYEPELYPNLLPVLTETEFSSLSTASHFSSPRSFGRLDTPMSPHN